MSDSDHTLTKVEERLLNELLAFRADLPGIARATASDHRADRALTSREARKRRSTHRRSLLERASVTAVVAGIVALSFVLVAHTLSGSRALAATPAPLAYVAENGHQSGRALLLQLAARAARQPALAADGGGTYAYVKTAGWYLGTRVAGDTSSSSVAATVTESWAAADGSGRVLRRGALGGGSRISGTVEGPVLDDVGVPPGGKPLLKLSADPNVLADQLDLGHPTRIGPVERFVAVKDLALEQPIPPVVEASILRLLADSPGLINTGDVVDRAGRPGVAVSLDSAYSGLLTRYTLILSPTGSLLGEEETLIGNAGKLDVSSPAVLAYTTFLSSGHTDSTKATP